MKDGCRMNGSDGEERRKMDRRLLERIIGDGVEWRTAGDEKETTELWRRTETVSDGARAQGWRTTVKATAAMRR